MCTVYTKVYESRFVVDDPGEHKRSVGSEVCIRVIKYRLLYILGEDAIFADTYTLTVRRTAALCAPEVRTDRVQGETHCQTSRQLTPNKGRNGWNVPIHPSLLLGKLFDGTFNISKYMYNDYNAYQIPTV